jgi:hypothetical protein
VQLVPGLQATCSEAGRRDGEPFSTSAGGGSVTGSRVTCSSDGDAPESDESPARRRPQVLRLLMHLNPSGRRTTMHAARGDETAKVRRLLVRHTRRIRWSHYSGGLPDCS